MSGADRAAWLSLPAILATAALIALAGSRGGGTALGVPLFAALVGLVFVVQWVAFVPAFLRGTERFFDITGSLTYVSVTALGVAFAPKVDGRSILLLVLVAVWAARLGTFLVRRVLRAGKDERFETIKRSFPQFLMTWTLQGLWITFTLAAAAAAITTRIREPLGAFACGGLGVWLVGFAVEGIADRQKSRFRQDPANKGAFIRTGLWAWSRHPNYFGEITLWIGVALIAAPVLRGWQVATLISPAFVALLITRVSGIPMLERRAEERWGGQPDYESYKRRTSLLMLRPPRREEPRG